MYHAQPARRARVDAAPQAVRSRPFEHDVELVRVVEVKRQGELVYGGSSLQLDARMRHRAPERKSRAGLAATRATGRPATGFADLHHRSMVVVPTRVWYRWIWHDVALFRRRQDGKVVIELRQRDGENQGPHNGPPTPRC